MQKEIFSNKFFKVAVEGQSGGDESLIISIQMREKLHDMPGEVLIAPGDIPDLVKALTDAALLSYLNDKKA